MALEIISASQRGTRAIIYTDCYMFTPDESANVSLLNHMRTQVNALSDPTTSSLFNKSVVWITGS